MSNKYPLLGYRRWNVDRENYVLTPATGGRDSWQPGLNLASGCHHPSPGSDCHCGFNAWYELKDAKKNYSGILGAIAAAGNLELHETGFRSSEAQVLALLTTTADETDIIERVGKKYGVPVFTSERKFKAYVQKHARKHDPKKIQHSEHLIESRPEPVERLTEDEQYFANPKWFLYFIGGYALVAGAFVGLQTDEVTNFLDNFGFWLGVIAFSVFLVLGGVVSFFLVDCYVGCSSPRAKNKRNSFLVGVALLLFVATVVFSFINLKSVADKVMGPTEEEKMAMVAIAEEKFFEQNNRYTTSHSELLAQFPNDIDGVLKQINITLSDDKQSYLASYKVEDEETLGLKGIPGEIETVCSGDNCGSDHFSIDESSEKAYEHLTSNEESSKDIAETTGFESSECLADNPIESMDADRHYSFVC